MSPAALEILLVFLLIVANGVFAMSEIAVVSARKVRLQQRATVGDKRAQTALDLANAPERFLSTVQIGITLIGILAGAFGCATIAETTRSAMPVAASPAPRNRIFCSDSGEPVMRSAENKPANATAAVP